MKHLLILLCLVILIPIIFVVAVIQAIAKLIKTGAEKIVDAIIALCKELICYENNALKETLDTIEAISKDEFEVPAESQVPVADFLEYKNGNIYPEPVEAQAALEILQKFFLGRDWYVIDPLTNGQVNACLVDAILSKFPNRYKRFAKLNGWRTQQTAIEKEPVVVERESDDTLASSKEAN